jgi:hypothetical protein
MPTIIGNISKAEKVKIRRHDVTGGVGAEATIEGKPVADLLAAIDTAQTVGDACPRCLSAVDLVFEDRFGTRLGTVSMFCSDLDNAGVAAARDALANACQTIRLADVDAVKRIVDSALGAAPTAP